MQSFVKIKPLRNGENSLSYTDVGKSCQRHELLTWQICLLTLLVKINHAKIFEIYSIITMVSKSCVKHICCLDHCFLIAAGKTFKYLLTLFILETFKQELYFGKQ